MFVARSDWWLLQEENLEQIETDKITLELCAEWCLRATKIQVTRIHVCRNQIEYYVV